jgi:hypothetical protein
MILINTNEEKKFDANALKCPEMDENLLMIFQINSKSENAKEVNELH